MQLRHVHRCTGRRPAGRLLLLDRDARRRAMACRGARSQLGYAVQLGTVRFLGTFLDNPEHAPGPRGAFDLLDITAIHQAARTVGEPARPEAETIAAELTARYRTINRFHRDSTTPGRDVILYDQTAQTLRSADVPVFVVNTATATPTEVAATIADAIPDPPVASTAPSPSTTFQGP
ncbi:DUF4158 domain-containing protein [Streptomyces sp. BE133]|uniref:DUF4158 domain-containing protein n=1 Tax=Streptomyces sp. BE133 TaxID=3002523 RepID=UPI002E76F798|nr:DUF4158 domain-containing protein [Streptomyces sp. BE133]MEE1807337.1 DUF4158 domain-containing protein [Streptomyces sp. BE133]